MCVCVCVCVLDEWDSLQYVSIRYEKIYLEDIFDI